MEEKGNAVVLLARQDPGPAGKTEPGGRTSDRAGILSSFKKEEHAEKRKTRNLSMSNGPEAKLMSQSDSIKGRGKSSWELSPLNMANTVRMKEGPGTRRRNKTRNGGIASVGKGTLWVCTSLLHQMHKRKEREPSRRVWRIVKKL